MRRYDQRKDAVFALYQRDVTGRPLSELLADAKPYSRELAESKYRYEAYLERTRRACGSLARSEAPVAPGKDVKDVA